MLKITASFAPAFLLASVVAACGGTKPADAPAPATQGTTTPADDAGASTPPAATTTDLPASSGDAGTKLASADGKKSEPGRSAEDIRAIVMAHRDEARQCYEASAKTHPDLHGDLSIGWVIDPKGNPTNVQVNGNGKTTLLDDAVQMCIVNVIKGLKFAPSPKGLETRTNYPFNFHPNKPAQ